ncbi:hypothetical protein HBH56_031680 [Parastagonospora nodorum]|uniref:Uncharacterized protein n=1 Tax=Phaeosphaeria nodorum (strain SN15 / ATCC MYA-4574 / FGSC 10173) TaxID=321614 RepID=A0A7U2F838_PHANO|nr:hypothetical protein HBH56_031680 [Parastagonospora nodorum]QRD00392.1 hypothetical protein JI435_072530 [Parastagonospora nodorum SN15]KAH3933542.1 hypothetical protein HBH54_067770 [Parastagonospora nodorum]KAH3952480.1 hypothetical protein HBH53_042280 [Parastagonospora nodorum]KAH4047441.1 hypothetical protein HBH49_174070 [Parastagonospora nodorum]
MKLLDLLVALATLCAAVLSAGPPVSWNAQNLVVNSAPDALHQAYLAIGTSTLCAMKSTDRGAGIQQGDNRNPASAESIWSPSEKVKYRARAYKTYKWDEVGPVPHATDFVYQGWAQTMFDLAPNRFPDPVAWVFKRFKHWDPTSQAPLQDQTYRLYGGSGPVYRCTGAINQLAINTNDGIVLFQSAISPKVATRSNWDHEAAENELPQLRSRADFAFLEWWALRRRDVIPKTALFSCAISDITDLATHRLISRYILARGMFDMENWPAQNSVFNTNTPEGLALLGSPAAQPCVALLVQHKKDLGIKQIVSVTVFRSPTRRSEKNPNIWLIYPNMVFKIEDVPQQQILPDPSPNFIPPPRVVVPDPQAGLPPRPNPVAPQPVAPQPVIPGPSTPQPNARSADRMAAREDPAPAIAYHIKQERDGKRIVRTHTFHAVKR